MNGTSILAIVLIATGSLGLIYGGVAYNLPHVTVAYPMTWRHNQPIRSGGFNLLNMYSGFSISDN